MIPAPAAVGQQPQPPAGDAAPTDLVTEAARAGR
jgi:hypothetical protein